MTTKCPKDCLGCYYMNTVPGELPCYECWRLRNGPHDYYTWPPSKPKRSKDTNHYDIGDISTIDVIRAKLTPEQYKGYCLGNVIKYACRLEHKGHAKEDVQKLWDYANWLRDWY